MNGRTCQLCGKPLSRIRVGTGGDFCSREHRNQYRLRCGMDRLLEANKMASLMRRRENLKPLTGQTTQPAAQAKIRSFAAAPWKAPAAGAAANLLPRLNPVLAGRMDTAAGFTRMRARPAPRGGPRGAMLPRAPRPRRPMIPAVEQARRPAAMQRASASALRPLVPPAKGACRSYGVMLRKLSRPHLGAPESSRIAPVQMNYGGPARDVLLTPKKGTDLRVCAAAGFRIPARTIRGLSLETRATAVMEWPEAANLPLPCPSQFAACRSQAVAFPLSDSIYPASRGLENAVALPGFRPVRVSASQPAASHRVGQAPFELHDPLWFRGPAGQEDEQS